ncbi:MAG: DUF2065 domain-containing protein [Methylotenera sp.]|nr:DUF2065 domain-containing protein [Methylotenera sp.]
MNYTLFTALGLMMVLEGLMPLLLPKTWRDTFKRMIAFNDGQLRFVGLLSVIGGIMLILLSK